jgi:hypothetical protein
LTLKEKESMLLSRRACRCGLDPDNLCCSLPRDNAYYVLRLQYGLRLKEKEEKKDELPS